MYIPSLCSGAKMDISFDTVASTIPALLDTIHDSMYAAAKKGRDDKMVTVMEWKDFVPALEKQCLVMTPFCDNREWEEKVKVQYDCYAELLLLFIIMFLLHNKFYDYYALVFNVLVDISVVLFADYVS